MWSTLTAVLTVHMACHTPCQPVHTGFTKREESEYDPFGAGHSSTSISAGLGMAVGRDFKGKKNQVCWLSWALCGQPDF